MCGGGGGHAVELGIYRASGALVGASARQDAAQYPEVVIPRSASPFVDPKP